MGVKRPPAAHAPSDHLRLLGKKVAPRSSTGSLRTDLLSSVRCLCFTTAFALSRPNVLQTAHAAPSPFRLLRLEAYRAQGKAVRNNILASVVDDDESVRESIPDLLRAFGFEVRAFESAEAFLASDVVEATKWLILDVAMPGMSGPELFEQLKQRRTDISVIFITAHDNSDLCYNLLRQGAIACLQKPFDPNVLVEAMQGILPPDMREPM